MKLEQLMEGVPFTLVQGSLDTEIADIIYDSRKAAPGLLFVCIVGTQRDSHAFAADCAAKGISALVIQHDIDLSALPGVTVVKVESSRYAMALMSANLFGNPARQMTMIGVTGTKGKTTTTYMMRQMMEHAGLKAGLIGTIEIIIGEEHIHAVNTTPESYLVQEYFRRMVDAGLKYVVMEVSSQALKLERVGGFTFDYGIFTNLEEDHIGPAEHPDMADYIRCKGLLFRRCKQGLANADADYLTEVMAGHTCALETFGLHDNADLYAADIHRVQRPGYLGVEYELNGLEHYHVRVDIPGDFTVYNSLAAIASLLGFSSQRHFQRAFREVEGCTPFLYRRRAWREQGSLF